MIMNSTHFVVIYIDHVVNSIIINQIKLIFSSVDKLNLKLIRAFTYLSQFRLRVFHRIDKSNIISDVLSRFSIIRHFNSNTKIDNLDLKFYHFHVEKSNFNENSIRVTLIEMSSKFRKKLIVEYQKDAN